MSLTEWAESEIRAVEEEALALARPVRLAALERVLERIFDTRPDIDQLVWWYRGRGLEWEEHDALPQEWRWPLHELIWPLFVQFRQEHVRVTATRSGIAVEELAKSAE